MIAKCATTAWDCDIVTTQVPCPWHAPVQPRNTWFAAGCAVSVTLCELKSETQWRLFPQSMPEGLLVTSPSPPTCTLSVCPDRESTRLNSRHRCSSYAVFCLK